MSKEYDYIVVGAGLAGSVFAQIVHENGKRVLVLEKRDHIGGNIYTERVNGVNVHRHGANIIHTNSR